MKVIETKNAPAAIGPYSQAYIVNGFIFTSGQIPVDPKTNEIPEGIIDQTKQACINVGEILKEAGTDFSNVIKTTCFIKDMNDFTSFNDVYKNYFTSKPARSCVEVAKLPKGVLCEIEAIAIVK